MAEPIPDPLTTGVLPIDLVNTRWNSGRGPVDWLDAPSTVPAFCVTHGHPIEATEVDAARVALTEARELLRRLFEASADRTVSDELLAEIERALVDTELTVHLEDGRPTLSARHRTPARAAASRAVVDAIELLRDHPDRIRPCDAHDCVLWFLDTSKGGRRRWCSMERCGNRAKARRHHERLKSSDT